VCGGCVRGELQLCPVVLPGIFWEVYGEGCKQTCERKKKR